MFSQSLKLLKVISTVLICITVLMVNYVLKNDGLAGKYLMLGVRPRIVWESLRLRNSIEGIILAMPIFR